MKYILLSLLFVSCSTAKELIDKAEKKDPASVATYAREKYPCKDLLKNDTAIIWRDSTIYIDCPDTSANNPYEVIRYDTINNVITKIVPVTKTIRVPVNMPIKTAYVTKWYEDSAKLKIAAVDITWLQDELKKLDAENEKLQKKVARKTKENWIWRAIALCLIAWQGWKFYRRLTTIKLR